MKTNQLVIVLLLLAATPLAAGKKGKRRTAPQKRHEKRMLPIQMSAQKNALDIQQQQLLMTAAKKREEEHEQYHRDLKMPVMNRPRECSLNEALNGCTTSIHLLCGGVALSLWLTLFAVVMFAAKT